MFYICYRYVNVKYEFIIFKKNNSVDNKDDMMHTEDEYEVRVRVKTLADASKIIQALDTAGYKDVEMGTPRAHFPTEMFGRMAEAARGRRHYLWINRLILRALYRLGAVDREHGVEIDKVVKEMKKNPESVNLAQHSSNGILSRTVTMVAHAILAEKHGWVSYDPGQTPRRFWLTEKGIEKAKIDVTEIKDH